MKVRAFLRTGLLALSACGMDGALDDLESVEAEVEEWRDQSLAPAIESAHPYTNNLRFERDVQAPAGAIALRLLLDVNTEQGYDFVEVIDKDGTVVQRLSGQTRGYSTELPGDRAKVRLTTDSSVTGWGFKVEGIRYKLDVAAPPPPTGGWQTVPATLPATSSPYKNNENLSWMLSAPGALEVRAVFSRFDTEARYDFVILENGGGLEVARYDGNLGTFTSKEVTGASMKVRFTSDGSVTRAGFQISRFEARFASNPPPPPPPGGGAGTGAACHPQSAPCPSGLLCSPEQNSATGGVCAQAAWTPVNVWPAVSTPHPYRDRMSETYSVGLPSWARKAKLQFEGFALEEGYDFLEVRSGTRELARLTGARGTFESAEFDAQNLSLRFTSDGSVTDFGFDLRAAKVLGVPRRLVAISLDPRQCNSDRIATDDLSIRQYLENQGVTLYGMKRYTFSTAVCRACSCPTGERVVMLVDAQDAMTVSRLTSNTGVFSVSSNDVVFSGRLALLSISPVQCGGNLWQSYCANRSCGPEVDTQIRRWADSLGAHVYASFEVPVSEVTCSACSCATGTDLYLAVNSDEVSKFTAHGFYAHR